MISFDFHNECCGCGVCADICPKKCITMSPDAWGFAMPHVDRSSCIDCKLCEKVCSVLNVRMYNGEKQGLYWGYNLDQKERERGSSGSIFLLLAKEVLSKGGVVCGAAFDESLNLHHIIVDDIDSIEQLLKSKYLQSDTNGIYGAILKHLKHGRKVLFCGTPCQVNALQNFIPAQYQNHLYVVDFVCHGVPSQKMFNDTIHIWEKRNKCKVLSYTFRYKAMSSPHCYKIEFVKDGISDCEMGIYSHESYYRAFRRYFMFRESCYKCAFARINRTSDITIGDCWGLERVVENIQLSDMWKGFSMFQINSNKGMEMLNCLKDNFYYNEFPQSVAIKWNPSYSKPTSPPSIHYLFMWAYKYLPYRYVHKVFLGNKIGLPIRIMAKIYKMFKTIF